MCVFQAAEFRDEQVPSGAVRHGAGAVASEERQQHESLSAQSYGGDAQGDQRPAG